MFNLKVGDNRYTANYIINYMRPRVRRFVIDTGAKYTCCSYDYINPSLKEEDFQKERSIFLGGFVANVGMKFYECRLKQFTIGTVDLKDQSVWITFDKRIADSLLGMDILKQVLFLNRPDRGCLAIYNDVAEVIADLKDEGIN